MMSQQIWRNDTTQYPVFNVDPSAIVTQKAQVGYSRAANTGTITALTITPLQFDAIGGAPDVPGLVIPELSYTLGTNAFTVNQTGHWTWDVFALFNTFASGGYSVWAQINTATHRYAQSSNSIVTDGNTFAKVGMHFTLDMQQGDVIEFKIIHTAAITPSLQGSVGNADQFTYLLASVIR